MQDMNQTAPVEREKAYDPTQQTIDDFVQGAKSSRDEKPRPQPSNRFLTRAIETIKRCVMRKS